MNISDDDLLLYHYRGGMDGNQREAIAQALRDDANLGDRLQALVADLERIGAVLRTPEPDARFEGRLWQRLEGQLPRAAAAPRERVSWLARWREGFGPQLAFASLLLVALGLGYRMGRDAAPPVSAPVAAQSLLAEDGARRVLATYLAEHLEATERALLVAANSPDEAQTTRQLAAALVDSNRLYAVAAERAGRPQLAQFLRQLEPVLIELAHDDDASDSAALGARIREQDLPFKARAAAAIARNELAPSARTL